MKANVSSRFAPYAPAKNVLLVIRRFHERGLPEALDSNELIKVGVPEGNVARTINALRFLGLLDEEGRRTAAFERIRSASNAEYPSVLGQIVANAYHEVFARSSVESASDLELHDAFRIYRPQAQRARMVSLFRALCNEAGAAGPQAHDRGQANQGFPRPRSATSLDSADSFPKREVGHSSPAVADSRYQLLYALLDELPRDGHWTKLRRDRWIEALGANLDLLIDVLDE